MCCVGEGGYELIPGEGDEQLSEKGGGGGEEAVEKGRILSHRFRRRRWSLAGARVGVQYWFPNN